MQEQHGVPAAGLAIAQACTADVDVSSSRKFEGIRRRLRGHRSGFPYRLPAAAETDVVPQPAGPEQGEVAEVVLVQPPRRAGALAGEGAGTAEDVAGLQIDQRTQLAVGNVGGCAGR